MKPNDITHVIIFTAIAVRREIGSDQDEVLYDDALEIALESSGFQSDSSVSSNSLCWKNSLPSIQRRALEDTENNIKQP